MIHTAAAITIGVMVGAVVTVCTSYTMGGIGRLRIQKEIGKGKRILIWGAGAKGFDLLYELVALPANREKCHVVGFIDDDPDKIGRKLSATLPVGATEVSIGPLTVLCGVDGLASTIEKYDLAVDEVVIGIHRPDPEKRKTLEELCSKRGIAVYDASTYQGEAVFSKRKIQKATAAT
jgi:FlaA1/EpsC-like NDP-sugar epimerase